MHRVIEMHANFNNIPINVDTVRAAQGANLAGDTQKHGSKRGLRASNSFNIHERDGKRKEQEEQVLAAASTHE